MALTVEDGTGLTTADALISLAYFEAYCDKRGRDYSGYTSAQREAAIVRASEFMSDHFRWKGYRVNERGATGGMQALAWPRTKVKDRNDNTVASDEVPDEIERATAEIAFYELGTPHGMQPVYTPHSRAKSEKVGPISVEYDLRNSYSDGARPVLLIVKDLVQQFLAAARSRLSGTSGRL